MRTFITFLLALCSTVLFAQEPVFVHTATAANIAGDASFIDHPDLNGNPNAKMVVTHNWNPPGSTGIDNQEYTGLYYSAIESKWAVYNESATAMIQGSSYNIYIGQGSDVSIHIADLANQGSLVSYSVLNHPDLNGNPNAEVIISTYYNPNVLRNDHPYGVWYDEISARWIIYNEDGGAIPLDSAFFYAVQPTIAEILTHTATAGNITGNRTEIDHSLLNNNPNGIVLITHNWGASGDPANIIMDNPLGVRYIGNRWAIFTEDGSAMPQNTKFNIMIFDPTLNVDDTSIAGLTYGPNPVDNIINIEANDPIASVTIYNIVGSEVSNFTGDGNTMDINMSNYTSGVYLARIVAGNATQTVKLIKR